MVFYTLWLELVGYSHRMAAGLVAGFSVGSCLGGLFGGYMGDFLAKKSPEKGRGAGMLPHFALEKFGLPLCIANASECHSAALNCKRVRQCLDEAQAAETVGTVKRGI